MASKARPTRSAKAGGKQEPVAEPEPAPSTEPRCLFKPTRGNKNEGCSASASTAWGYCTKHSKTKQGKEAREQYEKQQEHDYQLELSRLDQEIELELEREMAKEEADTVNIYVRQNRWGNYEDKDTGIVFDVGTKHAIGVQQDDGSVGPLDQTGIGLCLSNGWEYRKLSSV